MVITLLKGGLGNQLFQYAMGKVIALRSRSSMKMDLTFFETYDWHEYSLGPFSIDEQIADRPEIEQLKAIQYKFWFRVFRKIFRRNPIVINEVDLGFHDEYTKLKAPCYLDGYWQSESYFDSISDLLRKEFQIKIPPSTPNQEMLDRIRSSHAVSLHIRRGNYVAIESVNKYHGTCSMEYYAEAIRRIVLISPSCTFFVFSDDIPWSKENLKMDYPVVFVDLNDAKTDYEDLRLMSACQHHILANSTFSWWGAWLNPSPDKFVIAPLQWFADPERNKFADSIIPKTWTRI